MWQYIDADENVSRFGPWVLSTRSTNVDVEIGAAVLYRGDDTSSFLIITPS